MTQKNLFVAAGAGTGKTTRLSREYLRYLLTLWLAWDEEAQKPWGSEKRTDPVERLLAITFTEKASAEMKTRTRQLAQKIQEGSSSELASRIRAELLRSTDEENLLRFLTYVKKNLHKGNISTIHSFCASVLREYPREAQVDPEFTILDERHAEELLQNAVEKCALAQAETKTVSYILQQSGLYGKSSFSGGLVESAAEFIHALRSHGKDAAALADAVSPLLESGEKNRAFLEAMQGFPEFIQQVIGVYDEAKRKIHALDYEDLQKLTHTVLKEHPILRARLKNLFSFILVDEFQDINALQRDIIFFLAEKRGQESRTSSLAFSDLDENILFLVGDAKQSIYGFRGADVSVFEEARAMWEKLGWQKSALKVNFRSRSTILDFVNAFFTRIMRGGGRSYEVAFSQDDALEPDTEKIDKYPRVFRLCPETPVASQNKERAAEAQAIARQILKLTLQKNEFSVYEDGHNRPVKFGDVAILLRSLSGIAFYQNALREHHIPYHVVRGRGFYQSQEVLDVLNMLRALLSPFDELSLFGFLRSGFIALSDEAIVKLRYKQWFLSGDRKASPSVERSLHENLITLTGDEINRLCKPSSADLFCDSERLLFARETFCFLQSTADRLFPSELLVSLFDRLHLVPFLFGQDGGEQKAANLYKLIEFARVLEQKEDRTLHDFVRELERLYEKEPREAEASLTSLNAVKMLSVHQAKGLEFPVVFVADTGWTARGSYPLIMFSQDDGFSLKVTDEETGVVEQGEFYKKARAGLEKRDFQESMRIFYVACTRAKDYLFLSGVKKGNTRDEKSWSGMLDRFLEEDEDKTRVTVQKISYESLDLPEREEAQTFYEAHKTWFEKGEIPEKKKARSRGRQEEIPVYQDKLIPLQHFTVNVTALMNFFTCERKFYYGNVLNMTGVLEEPGAKESVRAMETGSRVHKLMQALDFNATKTTVENAAKKAFGDEWPAREKKEIAKNLSAFLGTPLAKKLAKLPPENILREHPFLLHVETKGGANFYVSGIIDLLFEDEEGFHVLDYKYARVDASSVDYYKTQLYLYALAVRQFSGKMPASLELAFLKEKPPVFSVDFPDISSLIQKLHSAGEKLSLLLPRPAEENFNKIERPACDALSCPFRTLCWQTYLLDTRLQFSV